MTHTEIVKKLIGNINPIGKSEIDAERFENLKQMCELVHDLVILIDDMAFDNRNAREDSVRQAADYAKNFLEKDLGIN